MISEERVKELYHLAAFDEYENKKYYQAGEYTMWDWINRVDLTTFVPKLIVAYAGFMIVYLLITARIYCVRYAKSYRKMKAYGNHLKRARRLLREEK